MTDSPSPDRLRLDKWLWAARFYKTRSLAAEEIGKGRITVNGQAAKASRDLRRHAGFEAAGLYDKAGMYREAFAIARETHATTGDDFDLDVHMKPILEQIARVEQVERWITPSVDPVEGVAILVSLPRSGTTR